MCFFMATRQRQTTIAYRFTVLSSLYLCGDWDGLLPLHRHLFQAVNELLESLAAPLEIVEGFVEGIKVTIPWAALVTDHCTLEVTGLQITCRPKDRTSKLTVPPKPG